MPTLSTLTLKPASVAGRSAALARPSTNRFTSARLTPTVRGMSASTPPPLSSRQPRVMKPSPRPSAAACMAAPVTSTRTPALRASSEWGLPSSVTTTGSSAGSAIRFWSRALAWATVSPPTSTPWTVTPWAIRSPACLSAHASVPTAPPAQSRHSSTARAKKRRNIKPRIRRGRLERRRTLVRGRCPCPNSCVLQAFRPAYLVAARAQSPDPEPAVQVEGRRPGAPLRRALSTSAATAGACTR